MKTQQSINTLTTRRDAKVRELARTKPFISGSLARVGTHCGNPACRCARGEKHEAFILTKKVRGKSATLYIPKDLVEQVKGWTDEWKRLKRLLAEVSGLNERIVRLYVRTQKAAAKNRSRSARIRSSPCSSSRSSTSSKRSCQS